MIRDEETRERGEGIFTVHEGASSDRVGKERDADNGEAALVRLVDRGAGVARGRADVSRLKKG